MLTHWNKLLNTDCVVVDIGPHTVYPIFKVAQSTLMSVCDKKYINKDIDHCNHVDIIIREPEERFVSGVNKYCKQNKLDVEITWKGINAGKIHDRHFTPQYIWLLHLYKWYKGFVTIRPFKHISNITDVHKNKSESIIDVPVIESFVEVDRHLTKYYNETVNIGYLIKRYKHALS
jgi:hypothetical protein